MRTFALGTGSDRKMVGIEIEGPRLKLYKKKPDGTTERSAKDLGDEAGARAEAERMVRDLLARGYVEQAPARARKAGAAASGAVRAPVGSDDEYVEPASPVLGRLATAPAAPTAEVKVKKAGGKKKKKKKGADGDALDKRVLGAIAAVCFVGLSFLGYVAYNAFLKPPTIVGTWAGSMIEFEIGRPMIRTEYRLVLDENKRASLTLQDKFTSTGTYTVEGDRLKLALKDDAPPDVGAKEDGEDEPKGEPATETREYKIALGRATLDLYDPQSGKRLVELIRFHEKPKVAGAPNGKAPAAPKDLAVGPLDDADKAADARLASVEFSPKDNAFRLRHPAGWEVETGSRPDNSYSWVNFTHGSAKILVSADVQGSLLSGSDSAGQFEEGSEFAPVHKAHEHHKRAVAEEYSDYKESTPAVFKGSGLGEGRIAAFTASEGGLLGGRLRGYRVTLLTNDRRVTLLCQCPPGEFAKLKPTFLAVCRSVAR